MLLKKLDEVHPEKKRKVSRDDQPFCTEKMKRLKRLKSREYHKIKRCIKWMDLNKKYNQEVSITKRKYFKESGSQKQTNGIDLC